MERRGKFLAQRDYYDRGIAMIGIIDYGLGNVKSMQNALNKIGVENELVSDASGLRKCDKIVFPGVGSFGAAVQKLKAKGLFEELKKKVGEKPFLGVCLGMQLLFEESEESEGVNGFGFFKGKCVKFSSGKVPQIGWNELKVLQNSKLFEGMNGGEFVYFVNSYFAVPMDEKIVSCVSEYGEYFVASVEKRNVFGLQFHPEKSGEVGLKILRNFAEL